MTVGEKLLYLRNEHGLTQDQIASHVNRSATTIANWGSGADSEHEKAASTR